MYNPKLYQKFNGVQRRDAVDILDEYLDLIKWQPNGGDVILDVGSGSGDTTFEVLLPRLPNNFLQVIGVDVCDSMVKYALSKYTQSNLHFDVLDIGVLELPEKYKQKFHHVFSFYCLHWVKEQRQAMKNIFDLLQPGGDMLVMFLASNPIYDLYIELAKMDKWKIHLAKKYTSPYHNVENAEQIARKILETIGFQVHVCHLKKKTYEYEDLTTFNKSVILINPYFSNMTNNTKKQFVVDFTNELIKTKFYQESRRNKSKSIILPYQLIIICASKPI